MATAGQLAAARAAVAQWQGRWVQTETLGTVPLPVAMTALAGSESGWNSAAAGDCTGGSLACRGCNSYGLWQINLPSHYPYLRQETGSTAPCTWATWLADPANCARAAQAVIGSSAAILPASALHPWTSWWGVVQGGHVVSLGDSQGAWLAYYEAALAAVQQVMGGGDGTALPPGPSAGEAVGASLLVGLPLAAGVLVHTAWGQRAAARLGLSARR